MKTLKWFTLKKNLKRKNKHFVFFSSLSHSSKEQSLKSEKSKTQETLENKNLLHFHPKRKESLTGLLGVIRGLVSGRCRAGKQASKFPVSASQKANSTFPPLKLLPCTKENAESKFHLWNNTCKETLKKPPGLVRWHMSSHLGQGNGQALKST